EAEEGPQRETEHAGLEIPQRNVDGGDGHGRRASPAPVVERPPHLLPHRFDEIGALADQAGGEIAIDRRVHGGAGGPHRVRVAQSLRAAAVPDAHGHQLEVIDLPVRAVGECHRELDHVVVGPDLRDRGHGRHYTGSAHGGALRGGSARRLRPGVIGCSPRTIPGDGDIRPREGDMVTKRLLAASLIAVALGSLTVDARAQATYPTRPTEPSPPFPPGAPADSAARIIQPSLSAALGVPIALVNRPGGGGALAADYVAKAKPDGYTVLAAPNAPLTT